MKNKIQKQISNLGTKTLKKYSLDDMLNQITENNKHGLEWDDNDFQGAEEW